MTYQGIVDNFKAICDAHEIIREFGYGAISDIKTMNVDAAVNIYGSPDYAESQTLYPYVYLVPGQSTRTSQMITYRFNMIVMDTVLDNGLEVLPPGGQLDQRDPPYGTTLEVQSSCQQYVDDILAQLRLAHDGGSLRNPLLDAQLSVNLTPFKERFQDTVAGMTATIELEVAAPLNLCIAPINDQLPLLLNTISVGNDDGYAYNYGQIATWDIPKATATYKIDWNFRIDQNVPLTDLTGLPNSGYNRPRFTIFEDSQPDEPSKYISEQSWTSNETDETTLRGQLTFTTRDDDPDDRRVFFGFGYLGATYPDGTTPTLNVPNAINTRGGSIRIYKVN